MSTLVQFAGDDRPARKRGMPTALTLFRLGHDTMEIAEIRGEPEHVVLYDLNRQRANSKQLPSPYEAQP